MNVPEPQGKEVNLCMFVDRDDAGDNVSHRSRNGFLIYTNTALVHWFSKSSLQHRCWFLVLSFLP